jgi:hypothetical protein
MHIAVTGHRPKRLGQHNPDRLVDLAAAALWHYRPTLVYIGMAQGWDIAVAQACIKLGVPFVAAVPFVGQAADWPHADYKLWEWLLGEAVQPVQVIGRGPQDGYKARDRWMVDRAKLVVALFDGRTYGGTYHTVWYAQAKGVRVANLWQSWQKGKGNVPLTK